MVYLKFGLLNIWSTQYLFYLIYGLHSICSNQYIVYLKLNVELKRTVGCSSPNISGFQEWKSCLPSLCVPEAALGPTEYRVLVSDQVRTVCSLRSSTAFMGKSQKQIFNIQENRLYFIYINKIIYERQIQHTITKSRCNKDRIQILLRGHRCSVPEPENL